MTARAKPGRAGATYAHGVPDERLDAFLARPLDAHLATHGPRVRPVWFLWEDAAFWILTGPWSTALREVQKNPTGALSIAATDIHIGEARQVVVRGPIEVLPWDGDRGWRMLRRYLGDDVDRWEDRFQTF